MKSINQHYRDLYIKSKFETLLVWSLFLVPGIFTVKIYYWLSPSNFWEQVVALIIIPLSYIVLFFIYFVIVDMINDRIK